MIPSWCRWGWVGLVLMVVGADGRAGETEQTGVEAPLAVSQRAIGTRLSAHRFTDPVGRPRELAEWLGKPLVISLVYTSCYHICSVTTRFLAEVVTKARQALGTDSFTVLTIGFDTYRDHPTAMGIYRRQQQVSDDNWHFLSADRATMAALVQELGFTYQPSPKGFDHVIQASVVDGEGVVYRQVYGETFEVPLLIEPLKELVLGRPRPHEPLLEEWTRRIRFLCTTYDPNTGGYRVDYSPFVGMFIGGMIILLTAHWLWRERRRRRQAEGEG